MRYFLFISYDGTRYHGWQIQPNAISVQATVEEALRKILRRPELSVVGAGRTDTGVHADFFALHFDSNEPIDPKILFRLNGVLPDDISANELRPVRPDAHARFSAISRTYEYRLSLRKNPFLRHTHYTPPYPLNFEKMNEAAATLLNYSDFTSFSRLHTQVKTNNCNVTEAIWFQRSPNEWIFRIKADRFLRNMVRAIVGTLFDVGRGKITVNDFQKIIEQKDRQKASTSAYAHGLSLIHIEYPNAIYD